MPELIPVKEQIALADALSAVTTGQIYAFEEEELSQKILNNAKKFLGEELSDVDQAITKLLAWYKAQLLEEIKQATSSRELGELLHRAPETWGRLPIFNEVLKELFSRKACFKERKYIIGMTVAERAQYIENAKFNFNNTEANWATKHQEEILKLLKTATYNLKEMALSDLLKDSLNISNYLLRNSIDGNLSLAPTNKLAIEKYSFYVEIHQQLRSELVKRYQAQLEEISLLTPPMQLEKLCAQLGELNKHINAEYANINSYNVSEHLLALEACKTLVSRQRQQLNMRPQLRLVSYTNNLSVANTVAQMPDEQTMTQKAPVRLRFG